MVIYSHRFESRMTQKIFCFDFDMTLTSVHSHGYPNCNTLYIKPLDVVDINTIFDFIKRKGDQIYIITRGIQALVQKIF